MRCKHLRSCCDVLTRSGKQWWLPAAFDSGLNKINISFSMKKKYTGKNNIFISTNLRSRCVSSVQKVFFWRLVSLEIRMFCWTKWWQIGHNSCGKNYVILKYYHINKDVAWQCLLRSLSDISKIVTTFWDSFEKWKKKFYSLFCWTKDESNFWLESLNPWGKFEHIL